MILRYAARDDDNTTTTIMMIALSGVGGRWPVSSGRWPVPGVRCPVSGARWPVPGGRCPVAGGRWPVCGGRWPVAGWPPVSGAEKVYSAYIATCSRPRNELLVPSTAGLTSQAACAVVDTCLQSIGGDSCVHIPAHINLLLRNHHMARMFQRVGL